MTDKDRHRQARAILDTVRWLEPPAGTLVKYGRDELRALEAELVAARERLVALRPQWPPALIADYLAQYDALCLWRLAILDELNARYLARQLDELARDRAKAARNFRYIRKRKKYGGG